MTDESKKQNEIGTNTNRYQNSQHTLSVLRGEPRRLVNSPMRQSEHVRGGGHLQHHAGRQIRHDRRQALPRLQDGRARQRRGLHYQDRLLGRLGGQRRGLAPRRHLQRLGRVQL